MKNRLIAAIGLLSMDFGTFVATVAFLPSAGSWSSSGPVSYFINSRTRWDIACAVLVAAMLFSFGLFLLLESLSVFAEKQQIDDDQQSETERQYRQSAGLAGNS